MNSTKPISSLRIVDGKPSTGRKTVDTATLLDLSKPSTAWLRGDIDAADINPEVASSVDELALHMCMGHIYLEVETGDGKTVSAPFEYVAGESEEGEAVLTCEEEVKSQMAAAPGMAPSHGGDHDGASGASIKAGILAAAVAAVVAILL